MEVFIMNSFSEPKAFMVFLAGTWVEAVGVHAAMVAVRARSKKVFMM
jgi:hypothetical protein